MGCVSSKQHRCNHCNCNTPYARTYSMHVHHPPQTKDDSYHVVALRSTTFGSLGSLNNFDANGFMFSNGKVIDTEIFRSENNEKKVENEANSWSNMIEHKLPKSISMPRISITKTPTCEVETEIINTWELMEGLEDITPLQSPNQFKSFSFDVNVNSHGDPMIPSFKDNDMLHQKMTTEECRDQDLDADLNLKAAKVEVSEFDDPQEVSSFNNNSLKENQEEGMMGKKISGDNVVDFKDTLYYRKEKVILYFTSLHGVRKTYEECCHVRLILKGLGMRVDERDVSMHLRFKEELKELLGDEYGKGRLPRVFIGGRYIGGAEEIQKLHEDGKLEKLLDCCEKIHDIDERCEGCGDIRFVPCETCYGSCKIYYEDDEDNEEDDDCKVIDCGFRRCLDCNENGLIRCPTCC